MKIRVLLFSILCLIFAFFAVVALGRNLINSCPRFNEGTLLIGDESWSIGIADSDLEKERGLAGCLTIPERQGLYFPFYEPVETAFWMKGMTIPIDIIWILRGEVVGIAAQVPPPANSEASNLPVYRPPVPIDAVLEIGAGQAQKHGIRIGTILTKKPS